MGKEKSKQAIADGKMVEILQEETSTDREKQRAFDKLYANHERQVLTYFLKHGKSIEVAEDLKMITFEKVHSNISKYDAEAGVFSTWMYKIALHSMIDEKRKDKHEVLSLDLLTAKENENYDNSMEFQLESPLPNPEQGLIKEESSQRVRDAIDEIDNPVTRQLMKHRFIDDMKFDEIAEKFPNFKKYFEK